MQMVPVSSPHGMTLCQNAGCMVTNFRYPKLKIRWLGGESVEGIRLGGVQGQKSSFSFTDGGKLRFREGYNLVKVPQMVVIDLCLNPSSPDL